MNKPKKKRKPTLASHLRSIARILEGRGLRNFPLYLNAAAKEISELRWENGVLRKKLSKKEQA